MNAHYQLTDNDLKVLRVAQRHMGFSTRPYLEIAVKTGLQENEVIDILKTLKNEGFVTRIGPFFNLDRSSGHVSLVAMIVPENRFGEVTEVVNSYQEVAHNYKRDHEFNMWFVLAVNSKSEADRVLFEIEAKTELKTYDLPKLKEYNLDLYLEV